MENKKIRENSVHLVGFLKENMLKKIVDKRGNEVITGSVIISTDEVNAHKVHFYVPHFKKNGEVTKAYSGLEALLPENTISIASYLKSVPTANYASAAAAASKVWVIAEIEEFASRQGERENSFVQLKGKLAGFKSTDTDVFGPHAQFKVDVYIENITNEQENGADTGRLLIDTAIPAYDGAMSRVQFVAGQEDNVAAYISKTYKTGDTVTINGDIINAAYREVEDQDESEFFGRSGEKQYKTRFVHERKILGGSKTPIHQGEEGCISTEEVKEGFAKREVKMDANGARRNNSAAAAASSAPAAAPASKSFSDLDF